MTLASSDFHVYISFGGVWVAFLTVHQGEPVPGLVRSPGYAPSAIAGLLLRRRVGLGYSLEGKWCSLQLSHFPPYVHLRSVSRVSVILQPSFYLPHTHATSQLQRGQRFWAPWRGSPRLTLNPVPSDLSHLLGDPSPPTLGFGVQLVKKMPLDYLLFFSILCLKVCAQRSLCPFDMP